MKRNKTRKSIKSDKSYLLTVPYLVTPKAKKSLDLFVT